MISNTEIGQRDRNTPAPGAMPIRGIQDGPIAVSTSLCMRRPLVLTSVEFYRVPCFDCDHGIIDRDQILALEFECFLPNFLWSRFGGVHNRNKV
jgi:hypothetical protein